mgnify:CR=1 FL=1
MMAIERQNLSQLYPGIASDKPNHRTSIPLSFASFELQFGKYWSVEDGLYIAEVPELAGCMADGKTYEEALKNAHVIIDEWIETAQALGRQIPEPKVKLAYALISRKNYTYAMPGSCISKALRISRCALVTSVRI